MSSKNIFFPSTQHSQLHISVLSHFQAHFKKPNILATPIPKMHYSKALLIASAFINGGLSASIIVYEGRDCTGGAQSLGIADDSCVDTSKPYRSYREDGWGSHQQRIGFFGGGHCSSQLYDTWAYNGDYFHSGKCYNLNDHPKNNEEFGYSVDSHKGMFQISALVVAETSS